MRLAAGYGLLLLVVTTSGLNPLLAVVLFLWFFIAMVYHLLRKEKT